MLSGPLWASFILIMLPLLDICFESSERLTQRGTKGKTGKVHISMLRLDPWTPEVAHECPNWTYCWPTKLATQE